MGPFHHPSDTVACITITSVSKGPIKAIEGGQKSNYKKACLDIKFDIA
jgi:hypothetical protein